MSQRILHIIAGLGSGGAETIVMNYYRFIDKEKIQFDFLVRNSFQHHYDNEVINNGGCIFYTSPFPKHAIKNYFEVNKILKEHKEYSIIHVHANSLIYIIPLILAKKHGISCRIIHSHSTHTQGKFLNIIHRVNRLFIGRFSNYMLACSRDAGKWMFTNKKFVTFHNGIDISEFIYSTEIRKKTRKAFGMGDKFVIGHVGRFSEVKNHKFILDVFNCILKKHSNSILILVGEGELFERIKQKAINLGIEKHIIFTGVRNDVNKIMQAMDVFLFPSYYEGLPLTLVEAQASGLPCIVSDTITDEVNLTDNIEYIDLKNPASVWADHIFKFINFNRKDTSEQIRAAGYDIEKEAKKLEAFYQEAIK